jgi:putative ABC transport system substrate-binding protein
MGNARSNRKAVWILGAVILLAGAVFLVQRPSQRAKPKVVAIATLVSHPALDALQQNIRDELSRQGFQQGRDIEYEIRNASGQMQLVSSIAREIAALKPDVTVAITTPVAQALKKVTTGPFVFAAVTDPVGAGIVASLETPEKLTTGASDAWPYRDQLGLIRRIAPRVRRVLVIFNPGEAASQYGMKQIRRFAPESGIELVEGPVNSPSEVYTVAENLGRGVDAIFLSSDSTAITGVAGAAKVAIRNKIPLFVGDGGTVEKGGVAAASIGYDRLGVETGKLVARILRGERNIPVVVPDGRSEIVVNTKAAELMGVEIPKDILEKAKVIKDISQ